MASSFFFFYYTSNYLIILLLSSIILDFFIGKQIWLANNINRKKFLLIISLSGNLGLLGFFKYTDFAILQFNFLGTYFDLNNHIPLLDLALPIGISFYTFQTISYTVDIYRGILTPSKTLTEFALFVSFFPQLVAGPILRAKQFLPQLREKMNSFETGMKQRKILIHSSNLKFGITMMSFGFLKKMFFADNISPLVDEIFANPIGLDSISVILGTIGFGVQIYCDFSGYSDIAIGAALIMGFRVPLNFNKPYFATSPSDFWKRWHISLSSWLRDYLYIPLGGNRKSRNRTYFNLMTVMFLGGLWHGSSWNFVIWGLLHGSYLAVHKIILDKFPKLGNNKFFTTKFGKIISILITQYFVFLAWIPFRVQELDGALYAIQKFVFIDLTNINMETLVAYPKLPILLIGLFFILHFISYSKPQLLEKISKLGLRFWGLVILSIILVILFFYNGNPESFIYFRF